ncbi:MAG: HEAT repeat protein [Planctomycetes bacterium ADurb.Bin126]|nr:MAG: HEAT repeat protein [Planctomycetes bacterium ADurb.Bin126]HOD80538.1 HEAT repeat domain-containing protein [Phycisphaerae bacterium]HQL72379.1 HEAT repeat domain-containing protein [Phycisphaerae bacterium]
MNTRIAAAAAWALTFALALGSVSLAAEEKKVSPEDAMKDLAAYKFGQSRSSLTVIEDAVRDSQKSPEQRQALAGKLAAMLGQKDVGRDAKDFICRQLSLIGGEAQVPALAAMLGDKDLSNLGRYALERMPCEAASQALRDALGKTEGVVKVGVINTLGERRDMKAAPEIIKLLGDKDPQIATAAAAAMGKIACPGCCKALGEAKASLKADDALQIPVTNALMQCAEALAAADKKADAAGIYAKLYAATEPRRVRIAALQGLVNTKPGAEVAPLVVEALKGEDAQLQACAARHVAALGSDDIKKIGQQLASFPPSVQVMLLAAMGSTGDQGVLPVVREAAQSKDEQVQVAALTALGQVGCPKCVPMLAQAAAGAGPAAQAAQTALAVLKGNEIDPAIVAATKDADAKVKVQLIKALAARRAATATPALLQLTGDADKAVQMESVQALALVADEKAMPEMVNVMLAAKDAALREALEKALASAAQRGKDGASRSQAIIARLKDASPEVKASLITVLSRVGDEPSLQQIQQALKDSNADVQMAAVRGLSNNWPDPNGLPTLLDLAKTAKEVPHKVLALRGYVRLVGLSQDKPEQKVKLLESALEAAQRAEDKTLVLGAVGQQKCKPALAVLTKHLDSPDTANAAAAGILSLARDKRFKGQAAKEFAAAKKKIQETVKDKRILDQAAKGL